MGKIIDRVRKRECALIVRRCEEMQVETKTKQAEFSARNARQMAAMQNIQHQYTDAMFNHSSAYNQMWLVGLQNSEEAKRWNEQGKAGAEILAKQTNTARKWWHFWR